MSEAMYAPELRGRPMPPNRGTTSDDRMDIANAVGSDLGFNLETALVIAERILFSEWYKDVIAHG